MKLPDNFGQGNTLLFADAARERRAAGERIYSLGLGEPDFDTPEHIRLAAVDSLERGETRYSAAAGIGQLRSAIATQLNTTRFDRINDGQVVVTAGAKAALFIAASAVLRPGDEVINLTPCYVSNHPILQMAEPGALIKDIDLLPGSFRLDLQSIEAAISERTKLLLLSFPNNPTGSVLHAEDLDELARILSDSSAVVLSDEVYADLNHDGAHLSPAAHPLLCARTIVVGGPSKTHAMTGWRAGWIAGPPEISKDCAKINLQIQTCVPEFIQRAVLAALEGPKVHASAFVGRIRQRIQTLDEMLIEPLTLHRAPIGGGFFAFVDVKAESSDRFCADLLSETGVAVIPGSSFGQSYQSWIRISLAASDEELQDAFGLMRIHMEGRS